MSWLRPVPTGGDDVFDENGDELHLQSREWVSNMKKRLRDGYVDGVGAGEDASLQAGFNQGFKEGTAQTAAVGRLKGIISAIWSWCRIQHPEGPVPVSVTNLLQQVTQYEDQILEDLKRTFENPPPSVSDISESMEELEVEQSCCAEGGCKESDCCRTPEKIDCDPPQPAQGVCSESRDNSSTTVGGLDLLLQRCMDVVMELGLPQDLIPHIEQLKGM